MGCTQNYLAPRYNFTATFLDAFTNQPIEGVKISVVDAVYSGVSVLGGARIHLVNQGDRKSVV